jgi:cytoskeletal protein CcmA (bactofilin family)
MDRADEHSEVSVVGRGTRIEGTVVAAGSLRVEGEVKGEITAEGRCRYPLRVAWKPISRRRASS